MGLVGELTYFDYQRRICAEVVIPWLESRVSLDGIRVGDFGAHHGGMVDALRESGKVASAVGLELRDDVVRSSPFAGDEHFRLEVADLMALSDDSYQFDLVLLHDVLEHLPDAQGALRRMARQVRPGGWIFVSFPPYYSGFGGHQHLARSLARWVPFLHVLPREVFLRVARPADNEYMTAADSLEDMVSVRQARLTLRKAERAFHHAGLRVESRELFLIRPEYTVRYGLSTRSAGLLGQSPLRELTVNGAFYLLRVAA
ncbi:MAG: class I SAM-dependent methyltransferase [Gaiellaceae bacterium]